MAPTWATAETPDPTTYGSTWAEVFALRDAMARRAWRQHGQRIPLDEYASVSNEIIAGCLATYEPSTVPGGRFIAYLGQRLAFAFANVRRQARTHSAAAAVAPPASPYTVTLLREVDAFLIAHQTERRVAMLLHQVTTEATWPELAQAWACSVRTVAAWHSPSTRSTSAAAVGNPMTPNCNHASGAK